MAYSHCVENFANNLQATVGVALYAELERLAKQFPDHVMNLRGQGRG